MSTGIWELLKLLFCLLRKTKKRKQTAGESWGYILMDLSYKHLGQKYRKYSAMSLHGLGHIRSSGCFAWPFPNSTGKVLHGFGIVCQWERSVSTISMRITPSLSSFHIQRCDLCPSLWSVPAWYYSCFGMRLLGATLGTKVAPEMPWRSMYRFGGKEPFPNTWGSCVSCLLEFVQPLIWGHWAPWDRIIL